jgi:hypothetical protein
MEGVFIGKSFDAEEIWKNPARVVSVPPGDAMERRGLGAEPRSARIRSGGLRETTGLEVFPLASDAKKGADPEVRARSDEGELSLS